MKKSILPVILVLALIPATVNSKGSKKVWEISTNKDEMNDEITKIYIANINKNFSIVLFDTVDDKKVDSIKFFFGNRYLNNGDYGKFYLRFDKNEAKETEVLYDDSGVFINDEEEIKSILTDMIASTSLAVRAFNYDGEQYDETVKLGLLKPILKQFIKVYEAKEETVE